MNESTKIRNQIFSEVEETMKEVGHQELENYVVGKFSTRYLTTDIKKCSAKVSNILKKYGMSEDRINSFATYRYFSEVSEALKDEEGYYYRMLYHVVMKNIKKYKNEYIENWKTNGAYAWIKDYKNNKSSLLFM